MSDTEQGKIYSTKDYSIFKVIKGNRAIKDGQVERLIKSIKECNLLSSNPIIVNPKMEVLDGQGRLAAAKRLGLAIHYIIAPTGSLEEVRLLNVNVKTWGMDDYLESALAQNIPDYVTLKKFHEEYAIPITICLVLLSGMRDRAEVRAAFKSGDFRVTTLSSAKRVAQKLLDIREYADRGVWRSRDFIQAVIAIDKDPTINHERLMKKFKQSGHTIYRQGSTQDYLRRFAEVHSYKPTAD